MTEESKFLSYKFFCKYCKKDIEIEGFPEIHTDEGECELCGSHGYTEIILWCEACKRYSEVRVSEW